MAAPYSLSGDVFTVGATAKFTVRKLVAQEQIWSTVAGAFVTKVAGDIANYGITATPVVVGDKNYVGNMPTSDAGSYIIDLYELAGASLALTDPKTAGPFVIKWNGTSILPFDDLFQFEFEYSPLDTVLEPEPVTIFRGQDTPIRFTAVPQAVIDQDFFKARMGTSATDYVEFSVALGNMTVDEPTGVILIYPTSAQTYALPANNTHRNVYIDLFRTGSGAGNATIVKRLQVNVENTLWTP